MTSLSINVAEGTVRELDRLIGRFDSPVERGQAKTIWKTVLSVLSEEYRRRFHEEFREEP